MRPRNSAAIDGESLQADVMRFMAIIAFCLVAIMALVRDVSPPVATAQPDALAAAPAKRKEAAPAKRKEAAPAKRIAAAPAKRIESAPAERIAAAPDDRKEAAPDDRKEAAPARQKAAAPAPRKESAPTEYKPVTAPIAESTPVRELPPELPLAPALTSVPAAPPPITSAPTSPPATEIAATPPSPVEPEPGLSLRFNSDRDFLRLVSKGEVAVYLFQGQRSLQLGSNYAFAPAPTPRQVYELLPPTIPAAIQASAARAVDDLSAWRWGVAMPDRIQSRIEALVAVERSGQLVINRFGEVQHRAALVTNRAEG